MADLFHALPKIGRKRMAASAFVQFEFSDLSRIIVHTGMELCCPAKSEEMAMRALSFFFAGLATFRRKIGALGRVVKGAQQRKTRRERPAGVLQSLMVRAGGFTG